MCVYLCVCVFVCVCVCACVRACVRACVSTYHCLSVSRGTRLRCSEAYHQYLLKK